MPKPPGSIADAVQTLATPVTEQLGLSLWDVRFFKEGADWILLLVIDKADAPVDINDCELVSHAIDPLLDEKDWIDQSYRLQVSSPGLERTLRTPAHFAAYLDQPVFFKLIRPYEGTREFHGTLADYDNGSFTVELPDGQGMTCTLKEVSFVKADDF
ncbi:MAG: ribosome maturation factor RimP [Oscillospiraceae bacterium]|jgi:ribosome maturation factor RimP|nr:ribosome maturation factor RimP [Oscillospiraceae bacterium]